MLTIAQNLPYTPLASANSEASDWRPTGLEAHTAYSSLRGFFVRVAVSFMGGLCGESSDSPIASNVGTPTHSVCPPQLALRSAGSQNLLEEMAVMPTYNLTHAVRQFLHGNLSSEDSQELAFNFCLDAKRILAVLSDVLNTKDRLCTDTDIASTIETCAALIETAQEIQAKEE